MAYFPSLKLNFIAYQSSKGSDCILKFTTNDNQAVVGCIPIAAVAVHLNIRIIRIGQSSHKIDFNSIVNFHESTTILIARTKKVWKLIVCTV